MFPSDNNFHSLLLEGGRDHQVTSLAVRQTTHDVNTKYFDIFATMYERSWSDLDFWSYHARINWNYTIAACMSYCLLVYLGQYLMRRHKGFNLRLPLILWNTILAVFSILSAVRIVPYTLTTLVQNGAWYFVCRNGMASYGQGGTVALWSVLFVYSKYFELVDTALLILRKKQVSFLHWFHHASVVLLSINALAYYSPSALIMSGMNSLVHTVMYTYYAIAAIRTRPPRRWGKLVTKLQLVQMWVGVLLGVANYLGQRIIDNCHSVPSHNALILGIYVSYLVLFTRFYFTKY
jgi:hypothetical protein